MTQEDKELLLKDLCARLPYGVKAHTKIGTNIIVVGVIDDTVKDETEDSFDISFIKPYLRPMSSMTEEEENEYRAINCYEGLFPRNEDAFDYVLSHHFDYRDLIEKSLALEAPEEMYEIK